MSVQHKISSTTLRLAITYLAIIMSFSIGFSAVVYSASFVQLGRQLPPPNWYTQNTLEPKAGGRPQQRELDQFFRTRIEEGRTQLLVSLILLNLLTLICASVLSYFLARRSLKPIELAMLAQNRFISDASHELKTPLTSLITSTEIALRRPKLTQAQAKQQLTANLVEAQKLAVLSEELLALLQLEARPSSYSELDLQKTTEAALHNTHAIAQEKSIRFRVQLKAARVQGNAAELERVVVILLHNAIKFSPIGSVVAVELKTGAGQVHLSIQDRGEGIDLQYREAIFERFFRVDSARNSNGNAGGHGLGLAIAKEIIVRHGGKIELVSTSSGKNTGSTFTLMLPLAKSSKLKLTQN